MSYERQPKYTEAQAKKMVAQTQKNQKGGMKINEAAVQAGFASDKAYYRVARKYGLRETKLRVVAEPAYAPDVSVLEVPEPPKLSIEKRLKQVEQMRAEGIPGGRAAILAGFNGLNDYLGAKLSHEKHLKKLQPDLVAAKAAQQTVEPETQYTQDADMEYQPDAEPEYYADAETEYVPDDDMEDVDTAGSAPKAPHGIKAPERQPKRNLLRLGKLHGRRMTYGIEDGGVVRIGQQGRRHDSIRCSVTELPQLSNELMEVYSLMTGSADA